MIAFILIMVFVAALVLYLRQLYAIFSKYGVKQSRIIPVIGNMGRLIFRLEHFADHIERLYNEFPNERFFGKFEFFNPVLVIRDIELAKKITIKDFEHFHDHRLFVKEDVDPLFGRNLICLKGQEWKDMRSTLSPAFTSSKIKLMVPFMMDVGEQMIKVLKMKIEASEANCIDIDCKDWTSRYTNDVIATCAFGLKVDSLLEEYNQLHAMGKTASTFNFSQAIKLFAFTSVPLLMKVLKVPFFTNETNKFFRHLVNSTMQDRETNQIVRPDIIHLLMETKKENRSYDDTPINDVEGVATTVEESADGKKLINSVWSNDDLIAQAVLFFIAGFETVSATMSFLLHELAVNPEVQERLAQEIKMHNAKTGDKLDYNSIQNMTYMDMVVSELLRLWPAIISLDRLCFKDFNLGKANDQAENDFILRKGTGVTIPVWAFHRDPKFFPDPLKFDPERFSVENKCNIQPFTYIPFGLGPRNCIGSRFALCEVKVMIYQLLLHMEVSPCEKTSIPAKIGTETFSLKIKGGHWIRLKYRN